MQEKQAFHAERGAESRARRRLLGLARSQQWPEAVIRTMDGWQLVVKGRRSWEAAVCAWCPASVVMAMHTLYERSYPSRPGGADAAG